MGYTRSKRGCCCIDPKTGIANTLYQEACTIHKPAWKGRFPANIFFRNII